MQHTWSSYYLPSAEPIDLVINCQHTAGIHCWKLDQQPSGLSSLTRGQTDYLDAVTVPSFISSNPSDNLGVRFESLVWSLWAAGRQRPWQPGGSTSDRKQTLNFYRLQLSCCCCCFGNTNLQQHKRTQCTLQPRRVYSMYKLIHTHTYVSDTASCQGSQSHLSKQRAFWSCRAGTQLTAGRKSSPDLTSSSEEMESS